MYTQDAFERELRRLWTKIRALKPHWYRMGDIDVEIGDAWEMYRNARNSTLSELLLGDVKLRSQIEVLKNFGTTSATETTMERQTLVDDNRRKIYPSQVKASVMSRLGKAYRSDHGIAHIRRGSVLNDGWWWPFKNDAWVIGGIHGLKRFHLTMADVPDDLIWDSRAGRPRVLGRELLGLAAFGYSLIGVPSWATQTPTPSEVARAPDPGRVAVTTTPVSAASVRQTIGNVFAPQSRQKAEAATFTDYYDALSRVTGIGSIRDGILRDEVAFDAYDFAKI